MVIENKIRSIGYDRTSDNGVTHTPSIITVQEMLKGVNNSQGDPYFQDNGVAITTLIYKEVLFCCTLFSHFLLILYREWYNL